MTSVPASCVPNSSLASHPGGNQYLHPQKQRRSWVTRESGETAITLSTTSTARRSKSVVSGKAHPEEPHGWCSFNTWGSLLFFVMGVAPWLVVNGIFVEMPILVTTQPEGEKIAAIIGAIVQVGNAAPFIYLPLRYRYGLSLTTTNAVVLVLCLAYTLLIGAFCTDTIAGHSLPLFIITFLAGVSGCLSKVTWFPFAAQYRQSAIASMSSGMGLSGLLVVVLGAVQGVGNAKSDNKNEPSGHSAGNDTGYTASPSDSSDTHFVFSLHSFFYILSGIALLTVLAFIYMVRSKEFNRRWGSAETLPAAPRHAPQTPTPTPTVPAHPPTPARSSSAVNALNCEGAIEESSAGSFATKVDACDGDVVAAEAAEETPLDVCSDSDTESDSSSLDAISVAGFEPSPGDGMMFRSLVRESDEAHDCAHIRVDSTGASTPAPPSAVGAPQKANPDWKHVLMVGKYELCAAYLNSFVNYAAIPGLFPYLQKDQGMIFWATTLYYTANFVGRYLPSCAETERVLMLIAMFFSVGVWLFIVGSMSDPPSYVTSDVWWATIGAPVFLFSFLNGYCSTMIPQMIKKREVVAGTPSASPGRKSPAPSHRPSINNGNESAHERSALLSGGGAAQGDAGTACAEERPRRVHRQHRLNTQEREALLQVLGIANQLGSLSGTYMTLVFSSLGVLKKFASDTPVSVTLPIVM
eukprot:Rhum_TRINITY_DN14378_c0_g1::Rhum_TRINITY_DN14378_c0_g1_i1::g.84319::m.84319